MLQKVIALYEKLRGENGEYEFSTIVQSCPSLRQPHGHGYYSIIKHPKEKHDESGVLEVLNCVLRDIA
jgi:hypothetical protein